MKLKHKRRRTARYKPQKKKEFCFGLDGMFYLQWLWPEFFINYCFSEANNNILNKNGNFGKLN